MQCPGSESEEEKQYLGRSIELERVSAGLGLHINSFRGFAGAPRWDTIGCLGTRVPCCHSELVLCFLAVWVGIYSGSVLNVGAVVMCS